MTVLNGKPHDLGGGMIVQRVIPQVQRRAVGPFVFFDKMGPVIEKANENYDVRPHPHIGLSTLTYLFEGRIVHRDSVGSVCTISPGDVNWMTAGRGISHSERAHEEDQARDRVLDGLQFWIALPDESEDCDPSFQNYKSDQIPKIDKAEIQISVVAGSAFGLTSPVVVSSPLVLAVGEAKMKGRLKIDFPDFDIGIYVCEGELQLDEVTASKNQILIFDKPVNKEISFSSEARFVLLGGKPFSTQRHIWWNLVATSKEKIEAAKKSWQEGSFPMVPGETEFIPLPK